MAGCLPPFTLVFGGFAFQAIAVSQGDLMAVENEIKDLLRLLGLQVVAGKFDVARFDQVINLLIEGSEGPFQVELLKVKEDAKKALVQC
ncbi:MAG: hypothetical protein IH937_05710 [Acidobacteria bacterium]|nr:hypothetical protein [Acidobacteriota bacterium]